MSVVRFAEREAQRLADLIRRGELEPTIDTRDHGLAQLIAGRVEDLLNGGGLPLTETLEDD